MKNSKINQELESIINLMGEHVSFVQNFKVGGEFLSEKIEGQVTDIVLHLDGCHEISLSGGDYVTFSDLLDFKVLDAK